MDKYRKEVRDRYGNTVAYREHELKTKKGLASNYARNALKKL